MQLYSYFRSSAAYRVRIALHLKGLAFETLPVHLVRGEQREERYRARNPQGLVPALVDGEGGPVLGQSLAILEYLEEKYPSPALLPTDLVQRARVRAFALHIACEIHPLNNLRVLQYLTKTAGLCEDAKLAWYRHWIATGFDGLEQELALHGAEGPYCFGEQITLADVCLVPQIYNARRFDCDLSPWPRLRRIAETCENHEAFARAHPSRQPDTE